VSFAKAYNWLRARFPDFGLPSLSNLQIAYLAFLGFLFVASFDVWKTQYRAMEKSEEQLLRLTTPVFSGKLDFIGFAQIDDADPEKIATFVIATVVNTGAPSIARDYELFVYTPDGKVIETRRFNAPANTKIAVTLLPEKNQICLNPNDLLDIKTGSEPIINGGARQGYLTFL